VRVRVSPGSPSHTIAALFLRQVSTWRSRQLSAMLSLPPTNHFALGAFHSRTRSHFRDQRSSSACSAQKLSGSSTLRR
jgi:hypothetical protein